MPSASARSGTACVPGAPGAGRNMVSARPYRRTRDNDSGRYMSPGSVDSRDETDTSRTVPPVRADRLTVVPIAAPNPVTEDVAGPRA
ncbi:hypothetical protein MF672_028575 [Actinomadura sp. ATCC 31491]|uniref:Uncharacterized protein n=1 Tax=Actinomadura luzonensis TaxID=2805427 RepID=A0ABT0FZD9_9ACTN|nr:hypothetical protein [Actinomadura luzonensis]MCK2217719.1 hypothetical protein [Actinomadura luzonensis]